MNKITVAREIFEKYPEIVAVYLFGSFNENPEQARDIDLAVLSRDALINPVSLYMQLYPELLETFSPLEVDLLFLKNASLSMAFEIISQGKVLYSFDENLRTDYEYLISGLYMDFNYHLKVGYQELLENIKEELGV